MVGRRWGEVVGTGGKWQERVELADVDRIREKVYGGDNYLLY